MAEEPVKVSVVMPVYNADQFLEKSIDSIINQTFPSFEFIIVCSDPTPDTKRILGLYQNTDPRIRVLYQDRKGIIHARNTGCHLARGEYIAVMDADDLSLPHRLETQVRYLDNHPDVGIVGSWAEIIDEHGAAIRRESPPTSHLVIGWYLIFGNCMAHLTVMMRSEVLRKLDYYTSGENGFPEDYDLWVRAFFRTRLANIPEFLGKYRMHQSNNSLDVSATIDRYCAEIQVRMVREIEDGQDCLVSEKMRSQENVSFFQCNRTINSTQVECLENLYRMYLGKYTPSYSEISEINSRLSRIFLSYSLGMLRKSMTKSGILFCKSLRYSKKEAIRQLVFAIKEKLRLR